jgi:citrate lyase beta subunit
MALITAHFAHLDEAAHDRLFLHRPQSIEHDDDPALRALALGATLYTPGIRPDLIADIRKNHAMGGRSQVLCLEDAIADHEVEDAQANVIASLRRFAESDPDLGHQLFVRVRRPEQIEQIVNGLGEAVTRLAGFVLPKFGERNGLAYLDAVADAGELSGHRLWAMPVLESREVIYRESRADALVALRRIIDKHRDIVLALRVGATDLSAAYALRRRPDVTLWDVGVVSAAIADIVNVFARAPGAESPQDAGGLIITGPVWEYFSAPPRLLRTQLRATPFASHRAEHVREQLMAADLDGLIREALLDRVNGLNGKTVIHPSHIHPVHALYSVTDEEFSDAQDIIAARVAGGGVRRSEARNKMNEAGPHFEWARRMLLLAQIFGVTRPGISFVDVLAAGRRG